MFKFFKKDNLRFGLILGFLAPFIGMFGFYLWKFKSENFIDFVKFLGYQKQIITAMVSFSLLANAILFTLYVNNRKDRTARGIFILTCLYAIFAIILKLVYG